ncbi:quercetin 2,3-dioxygenase [Leptolyngbya sp. 'hensonii']|uniref:pirin family protein n=1 Tax=Leptolyngbya sp. 'hensonii' TaxID=1922337 RepID=UPI00094FF8CB|nr:pirin family protein [Leptolyngbya sp. 'hensonii']OLP16472.1 quercetin 2,3-dioxygenase [Leptolyngbya sp. 'hensonii']
MTQSMTGIRVRKGYDRGHVQFGWLDSYHTFSFGNYYDPQHMGFRALRVINDDRIAPGAGFPTHGHRDMEIITYMLEGSLEHKDSLGTGEVIRPGEVQRMTAGTGIAHSEFNHSQDDPVHLLQIWILPERQGLEPGYEQKLFPVEEKRGQWRLLADREGRDGALTVHQDLSLYATVLQPAESVTYDLKLGRHAWIQIASGIVTLNGEPLRAGDGVAVSEALTLEVIAESDAELLLFDLA